MFDLRRLEIVSRLLKVGVSAQIRELPPFLRIQEFLRKTFEIFCDVLFVDDANTYITRI